MQYNACDQGQVNTVSYLAQCFGFSWMFPGNSASTILGLYSVDLGNRSQTKGGHTC